MIRLSSSTNMFETTITHTGTDGETGIYNITHNLNSTNIEVFILFPNSTGKSLMADYFFNTNGPTAQWGFSLEDILPNSCKIRMWRWYPADNQTATKTANVIIKTIK